MTLYCRKCNRVCDYDSKEKIVSCDEVDFDEKNQTATRKKGEPHSCSWSSYLLINKK